MGRAEGAMSPLLFQLLTLETYYRTT
jgi:hypothetical protein